MSSFAYLFKIVTLLIMIFHIFHTFIDALKFYFGVIFKNDIS